MNQKEMEKLIWEALEVMVNNLEDFDPSFYRDLRNGWPDGEQLPESEIEYYTTKAHRERFDKAAEHVSAIVAKKAGY